MTETFIKPLNKSSMFLTLDILLSLGSERVMFTYCNSALFLSVFTERLLKQSSHVHHCLGCRNNVLTVTMFISTVCTLNVVL